MAVTLIKPIEVDLSTRGIQLPSGGAGMVLAQPHLTLTPREPYRCTDESRSCHLEAISAAMAVARDASHGAEKTHFTVFPEYSIPSLEGIELVEHNLRQDDWPNQTIVIGGTDGLSLRRIQVACNGAPHSRRRRSYDCPA